MLTNILDYVIIMLSAYLYIIISLFLLFVAGIISFFYGILKKEKKKRFIFLGILGMLPFIICLSINSYNEVSDNIKLENNLTYQVSKGTLDDVEELLKEGINPECYSKNRKENVVAKDGQETTLFYLCSTNNVSQQLEKLQLLIDYGADVNRVTYNCNKTREEHEFIGYNDGCGETPLMKACHIGNIEVVKKLIENGADVNIREFSGRTALHHAVFYDELESNEEVQMEIIKILLENGIDKNIEGYYHGTVLDCAKEYQLEGFVKLLE